MRYRALLCASLVSLLLGLFAAVALGQEITGNIAGTVTDASGAAVPGASVTLTNTDRNVAVRTLTTGAQGEYSAPLLPIGHYAVSAEAAGFKKVTQTGVELNVNDHLTVNLTLQVGSAQQSITVQASPLQVNLQTPAVEGLINGTQIRELSLNNRNYEQLVALMPGVSVGTSSDQLYVGVTSPSGLSNQINFSVNGGRPTQNNWTIDGADNVDRGANLTLLNYPSVDAIAEFKVERGLFNPEFGRSSSGEINVITRSGTSDFHGGVYEFFRNDVLAANNFANNAAGIDRPALRYNDFGWTFGGPVYIPNHYNREKNKTFFFYSEELRRIITYTTFASGETATPLELTGNFSATGPVCLNVACTTMGTQVPSIDPVAAAYVKDIFSKLPAPNPSNGNTLTFVGRNTFNFREENIRVDHVFGPRLSVFGRWLNDSIPTVEPGGLFRGSALPGVATTDTNSPGHNLVIRATMTISPTFLNEAGYAYSYGAVLSTPVGLGSTALSPDIASALKLPFPSTVTRVPDISFADGGGEPVIGFGPYRDFNRNHSASDTVSLIRGQHSMKFGVVYYHYNKSENAADGNNGAFSFGDFTGNFPTFQQDWANFLLGEVATFSQTSKDFTPDVIQNQIEWYAQDQFRVRPNVTLTYGLRQSIFRQPFDANGNLSNFDPAAFNTGTVPTINPTSGAFLAGQTLTPANYFNGVIIGSNGCQAGITLANAASGVPPICSPFGSAVARQTTAIAPRIGIAWDPFGHGTTSIRTGYGIFYDSPSVGFTETNVFNDPPFVNSVGINNTTFSNPGGGTVNVNNAPIALNAYAADWKIPYTQEWSLDVQHQFTPSLLADIGYHGNKGTHLIGDVDINQPVPGAYQTAGITPPGVPIKRGRTTSLLNLIRPYLGYDAINEFKTIFDSNYNSLQVQVQKRLSGSSQLNFNYTWSHALTTAQGDFRVPQDSYNIQDEYGPAQFDRRHIFNANYVYDLPFYRGQQGLEGHLLGGWELSGIVNFYSGLPLTVTGGRSIDPAGLGLLDPFSNSGRRPDQVGNPNVGAPHNLAEFFNITAFANIPAGGTRPGDAPRGSVTGPGAQRWDLSLFKNTNISERVTAQFRAESFNFFNHTNYNVVSTSLSSSLFGHVLTTRDPRIIQLALKLNF